MAKLFETDSSIVEKARDILLEAKEDANSIIKELEKENISNKEANILRNELNKKIQTNSTIGESSQVLNNNSSTMSPEQIKIGDIVFLPKLNQNVTIISLPNKTGELTVQAGIIKTKVSIGDLSLSATAPSISNSNSKQFSNNRSLKFSQF